MIVLSEVIKKLNEMLEQYGDKNIRIVNYHSDFRDANIENIDEAITYNEQGEYILIGGESR
jgi:reverse gyrase